MAHNTYLQVPVEQLCGLATPSPCKIWCQQSDSNPTWYIDHRVVEVLELVAKPFSLRDPISRFRSAKRKGSHFMHVQSIPLKMRR